MPRWRRRGFRCAPNLPLAGEGRDEGESERHELAASTHPHEATRNRVQVPRAFYDAVKAALQPGATILVTQSSVGAAPGRKITILDAITPAP